MVRRILIFQRVSFSETQILYSTLHITQLYPFCLINSASLTIEKCTRIFDTIALTPKWLALCICVPNNWKIDNPLVKMANFAYCSSFQPTSLRDFLQLYSSSSLWIFSLFKSTFVSGSSKTLSVSWTQNCSACFNDSMPDVFNEAVGILLQNDNILAVTPNNLKFDEYLSIRAFR